MTPSTPQTTSAQRSPQGPTRREPNRVCKEEVEAILLEARELTRSLRRGTAQVEVAMRATGPAPYGIGVMLYRLQEKQLLLSEELAYDSLLRQQAHPVGLTGAGAPANRRTVIDHLRKIRLIEADLPVRALKPSGTTPNVGHVLRVTEERVGVSGQDVLSRNRSKTIVTARFFAMWALRTVSGTSFSVIGEQFGGKDHTTVINAVSQVELRRRADAGDRAATDQIVDEADLLGIRANMDLLLRPCRLRLVS